MTNREDHARLTTPRPRSRPACPRPAAAVDQEERLQREESDFLRHVDSSGKVLDFHAIRHTYISGIVAGNASVKVAQELARHSTARLTVDRYSHIGTQEKVEALDGVRLGTLPQNGMYIWQHTARETPLLPATGCEQPQCATKNADDPKSKESHALDAPLPPDATGCNERRRRDSNPGWRICNPLPNPLNPEENGPQENRLAEWLVAPDASSDTTGSELNQVIEAWSSLPPDIRTAILTIVAAAAPSAPWLHDRAGEGGEISTVPP